MVSDKQQHKDDAEAQFNLVLAYSNGQGVPQNSEEASYWLDKAAAGNLPQAVMLKNPSLATLKAALSSSPDHLGYFFQYGLKKFSFVFLKQRNNQLELVLNCNVGMSKKQLGEGHFCRVFEGTLNGTTIAAKYIKVLSDVPDAAAGGMKEQRREITTACAIPEETVAIH